MQDTPISDDWRYARGYADGNAAIIARVKSLASSWRAKANVPALPDENCREEIEAEYAQLRKCADELDAALMEPRR